MDNVASVQYSTEIYVDEVLCFLKSAFTKGTVYMLKTIAVTFYTADELSAAKAKLAKLQKTAENIGIDGLRRLKKNVLVLTKQKQKLMLLLLFCSCQMNRNCSIVFQHTHSFISQSWQPNTKNTENKQ